MAVLKSVSHLSPGSESGPVLVGAGATCRLSGMAGPTASTSPGALSWYPRTIQRSGRRSAKGAMVHCELFVALGTLALAIHAARVGPNWRDSDPKAACTAS